MTLFVLVISFMVTLTVLWNVLLVQDYQKLRALAQEATLHWTWVWLGSALFVTIIVMSSILSAMLIGQIRWSQRQSNFIASVSHELNSPLSSIKLFAQTLRKEDLDDADRADFVDKILFDVERLHRLISNILRAAEMDHKDEELQVMLQSVELTEYLQSFLEDARALYPNAQVNLELPEGDGAYLPTRLDPVMFRQVLDNLIDNAVRYRGPEPAHITLRARRAVKDELPVIQLRVADRGAGIDPVDLPSVFERFYRSENPVGGRQKGTGIGLYVVRSILRAHGGSVEAESAGAGRGTAITLTLPTTEISGIEVPAHQETTVDAAT